jgi:hypothetical protein
MKYQVKEGYTFGGVNLLPAGALVELTAEEAAGFLDKLALVEGGEPETPQPPAQAGDHLVVSIPGAPGAAGVQPPAPAEPISTGDVKAAVKAAEGDGGKRKV